MELRRILIVEDEIEVGQYLQMAVGYQGYLVDFAQDGDEAIALLEQKNSYAAVLLDIGIPGRDGLEILRYIRQRDATLPVIIVSGASSPVNIVEAIKCGASDFMGKPVAHEALRKALNKALEQSSAKQEPPSIPASSGQNVTFGRSVFFGRDPVMASIHSMLPQIAAAEAPVLILGETGVGKEVIAREIQANSPRAKKPLLKLNCAALPSELVESELFGYERGAFTGAFQRKPGMFELADGGILLLDEIGDMDFKLQAKLLQVLQDHQFQRLGGKEVIQVDIHILAATHKNLKKAIAENTFRQDLYYRLSVITLEIPSLRERKGDLIELAGFLLSRHSKGLMSAKHLIPRLKDAMLEYDWPGNIRELDNIMRRFWVLRDADPIAAELELAAPHRTFQVVESGAPKEQATILEQVTQAKAHAERTAIIAALESTQWNRKKAAILLKIDYKALLYKMKKLAIEDKMITFPKSSTPEHTHPVAAAGHS